MDLLLCIKQKISFDDALATHPSPRECLHFLISTKLLLLRLHPHRINNNIIFRVWTSSDRFHLNSRNRTFAWVHRRWHMHIWGGVFLHSNLNQMILCYQSSSSARSCHILIYFYDMLPNGMRFLILDTYEEMNLAVNKIRANKVAFERDGINI